MARLLILILGSLLWFAPATAAAHGAQADAVRVHTVYRGQRLGSIAKRYNVSVAAICSANGIRRSGVIRPGQELLIPSRKDKDGSVARQLRLSGEWPGATLATPRGREAKVRRQKPSGPPRLHTVYKGQRLGSIAKRYNVSVASVCRANDIKSNSVIRPGQKLVIPARDDKDGSDAREWRLDQSIPGTPGARGRSGAHGKGSWSPYVKPPWRRGYVNLIGHHETWKGYVVGRRSEVLSGARRAVSRVLTAPSSRRPVHRRLVKLLAEVSDTFGGRPLRIISGYRTTSFVKGSRHKSGRAVDFRIPGVPNEALRDYLRTFSNVGVGYYPNSTFVHLDVRKRPAYWVDYAGPGEPPRLKRSRKKHRVGSTTKATERSRGPDQGRSRHSDASKRSKQAG